jgi:(2Fe-2S) ferredoxin
MPGPTPRIPEPTTPLGLVRPYEKPQITVCAGPESRQACGGKALYDGLVSEAARLNMPLHISPGKCGCSGECLRGPFVSFPRLGIFYHQVKPEHIPSILRETIGQGKILFPILRLDHLQAIRENIIWEKASRCIMTLDPSFCMVQVAAYLIRFHSEESCGKCVPCRLGIKRLTELIENITRGQADPEAAAEMESLIGLMTQAAYCAFAGKASTIIRAILSYFPEEFESHIKDKRCPAGACKMY